MDFFISALEFCLVFALIKLIFCHEAPYEVNLTNKQLLKMKCNAEFKYN